MYETGKLNANLRSSFSLIEARISALGKEQPVQASRLFMKKRNDEGSSLQ